jgi:hypothetical protein
MKRSMFIPVILAALVPAGASHDVFAPAAVYGRRIRTDG